jgi:ABC-2 type transport system permease protein
MFLGAVFDQTGGASGAWTEFTDFLGGLGYAAITAVVFGAFAVPLASLSSRRAVGAVVIAAAFTVTTPIIGVVSEVGGTTARQLVPLVNPVGIVTGLETWVYRTHTMDIGRFGPLYLAAAVAVVGAGTAALILRYRKVAA